jgi:hypothetical protein
MSPEIKPNGICSCLSHKLFLMLIWMVNDYQLSILLMLFQDDFRNMLGNATFFHVLELTSIHYS